MAQDLESRIWDALKTIKFPGMKRDIVSFGFVRGVEIRGTDAVVEMEIATQNDTAVERIRGDVRETLTALPEIESATIKLHVEKPELPHARAQKAVARDPNLIPEVRHVVAVASGKGGVGKSTVSANLAVSLAALGHRVGLLDADIYGPSMPLMFGITDKPAMQGEKLLPFECHGVKVMSLGVILDTDTPVIWRGPMVMRALEQLLGDVAWGALDYLIVDMPPGTGDAQLTLSQKVPLAGAVIVTTPQDVALIDARKGLAMFRKVQVPVVGLVENMSMFVCPHCGESTPVFKHGGGERTAKVLQTRFLGAIPLDPAIVEGGDSGVPIAVAQPDGSHAAAFRAIAEAVIEEVDAEAAKRPKLSIV